MRGGMESNEDSQGHDTQNSTLLQYIYNNINGHPENDNSMTKKIPYRIITWGSYHLHDSEHENL